MKMTIPGPITIDGQEQQGEYVTLWKAAQIMEKAYETVKSYAKHRKDGLTLQFIVADNGLRYTTLAWIHEFLLKLNKSASKGDIKIPANYTTPDGMSAIPRMYNFMRPSEVARKLGVTRQRVHQMIRDKVLQAHKDPYYGLVIHDYEYERIREMREEKGGLNRYTIHPTK